MTVFATTESSITQVSPAGRDAVPEFTEMRRPALWDNSRPSRQAAYASTAPRTVVLGYDGSQAARRALRRAAEAAGSGGRVVVVTAVPPSPAHAHEVDSLTAEPEDIVEEAAALLREDDVEITTCVADSEPAEALVA